MDPNEIPPLLRRVRSGDAAAESLLYDLLSGELREAASALLRRESHRDGLDTTGLVHEVWMRLFSGDGVLAEDQAHFLAIAARTMRRVLIDHARRRKAEKRGSGSPHLPLDLAIDSLGTSDSDLLELNEILLRMQEAQPDLARVVELRFFTGITMPEVAAALGISLATAERRWRIARLWLHSELRPRGADAPRDAS